MKNLLFPSFVRRASQKNCTSSVRHIQFLFLLWENHRQMFFIYETFTIPLFLLYFQLREYSNLAEVGGPQISSANPQIFGNTFFFDLLGFPHTSPFSQSPSLLSHNFYIVFHLEQVTYVVISSKFISTPCARMYSLAETKEVNKEQPSYRNLSATATRVLQCTCPVAASWKYFSAIHPTPHLTSTHLTPDYVNTMILHLVSVLYTAVNVWNKNSCLLCLMNCFHYLA